MDIAQAFKFVFDDEKWLSKVGLGGLIAIVPILNFAVAGYMIKVAENVARGQATPLPEWNNLGEHFMRGLYALVINLVYFIPYILIVGLFSCVLGAVGGTAGDSSDAGAAATGLISLVLVPVYLVIAFVSFLFAYAGLARYVATGSLSEAFKFGEVFAMVRSKPGVWLMLVLVLILASLVGGLGAIACGVGALFTGFYGTLVQGHALGQTVQREGMLGSSTYAAPPSYEPPPSYDPPPPTYQ